MKKINKKNKKKGFTLVELLATIVILGIVLLLGINAFGSIKTMVLERQYDTLVTNLYAAGKKYYSKTTEAIVFIDDLVQTGYYGSSDEIKDPVNNGSMMNLFFNMKDGQKKLYYCESGSCDHEYSHQIKCGNNKCIKDSYAYTGSISIVAYELNDDSTLTSKQVQDNRWTNKDLLLKPSTFAYEKNDIFSGFLNNYESSECKWYSKSNPNAIIGDSCYDGIIVHANTNSYLNEEFILVLTAKKKYDVFTIQSEKDNTIEVVKSFNVKIDKLKPNVEDNLICNYDEENKQYSIDIQCNDDHSGCLIPDLSGLSEGENIITIKDTAGNVGIEKTVYCESPNKFDLKIKCDRKDGYYVVRTNCEVDDKCELKNFSYYISYFRRYDSSETHEVNAYQEFKIDLFNKNNNKSESHGPFFCPNEDQCRPVITIHYMQPETIGGKISELFDSWFDIFENETDVFYYCYEEYLVRKNVYLGFENETSLYYKDVFEHYEELAKASNKFFNAVNVKVMYISGNAYAIEKTVDLGNMTLDEFKEKKISLGDYCKEPNIEVFVYPYIRDVPSEDNFVYKIKYTTSPLRGGGSLNSKYNNAITIFEDEDEYKIPGDIIASKPKGTIFNKPKFFGWSREDYSGQEKSKRYGEGSVITKDDFKGIGDEGGVRTLILVANWESSLTGLKKLILDANGGTIFKTSTTIPIYATKGTSIDLNDYTPTRSGYMLSGWCTTKNCSGLFNKKYKKNDLYTLTKDTTLYAQWTNKTFSITYDANGGKISGILGGDTEGIGRDKYVQKLNGLVTIGYSASKEGSEFMYWSTLKNGRGKRYVPGQDYAKEEDLTLYAIYHDKWTIEYVTLGGDSGTRPPTQTGNKYTATKVSEIIPQYYDYERINGISQTFYYWSDDDGNIYNPGDVIWFTKEKRTLTAIRGNNKFTVTYDPSGGIWDDGSDSKKNESVKAATEYGLIEGPNKQNYTFLGWQVYDSDKCNGCYSIALNSPGQKVKITGNVTFVAQYIANLNIDLESSTTLIAEVISESLQAIPPSEATPAKSCTIIYKLNDTNDYMKQSYSCGMKIPIIEPDIENFDFHEWDESSTCKSANYYSAGEIITLNENKILYACGQNKTPTKKYSITFKDVDDIPDNILHYGIKSGISESQKITLREVYRYSYKKSCQDNKGNTKNCSDSYLKNIGWECSKVGTISIGSSFSMPAEDITCTAIYYDICKYDQVNQGSNEVEASYPLSHYNNPDSWGSATTAKGICYSHGEETNGKFAKYRLCSEDECDYFKVKGETLKYINDTFGCDYNIYWCS